MPRVVVIVLALWVTAAELARAQDSFDPLADFDRAMVELDSMWVATRSGFAGELPYTEYVSAGRVSAFLLPDGSRPVACIRQILRLQYPPPAYFELYSEARLLQEFEFNNSEYLNPIGCDDAAFRRTWFRVGGDPSDTRTVLLGARLADGAMRALLNGQSEFQGLTLDFSEVPDGGPPDPALTDLVTLTIDRPSHASFYSENDTVGVSFGGDCGVSVSIPRTAVERMHGPNHQSPAPTIRIFPARCFQH